MYEMGAKGFDGVIEGFQGTARVFCASLKWQKEKQLPITATHWLPKKKGATSPHALTRRGCGV